MTPKEQWLEDRNKSGGGSDTPAMLGISPFTTPLQLYAQKAGLAPPVEETDEMRMGHFMEPHIAVMYSEKTERNVFNPGRYLIQRSPHYPDMHATLDRTTWSDDGSTDIALQIKNVSTYMGPHWDDGPPLYVQAQIQHEIAVSDCGLGAYAALIGGNRFEYDDVPRHDSFIAYLAERWVQFMDCVRNEEPPQAQAEDTDALRLLYPKHEPGEIKALTGDAIEMDAELWQAMLDARKARRKVLSLSNRLKQVLGTAERGVLPNGAAYSFRGTERKGYTVKPRTVRTLRRLKK